MKPIILDWLKTQGLTAETALSASASNEPLLILAARQGNSDVLAALLEEGADLCALDFYGNNALWAACYAESVDCINLLLAAGIDIDFQNATGATALIYSSSCGKQAVVTLLLAEGANPFLTTLDEFSAMDLAANLQCLKLLRHATKIAG